MISITLLTRNHEKRISDVLESVAWADEVILIDTGSTDHTLEVAKTFPNVKIEHAPFSGLGKLRNLAASKASHDWIFSLDSDEVISDELKETLEELTKDPLEIYSFPRQSYFNEKWIKTCGWYPSRKMRLYNRKTAHFTDHKIGQYLVLNGVKEVKLTPPIHHYPFTSIADMLEKIQQDSDLFAAQHHHREKSSILQAHFQGVISFWKAYLFKGGIFSGTSGYIISRFMGHLAFYQFLKLRQANLDLPPMGTHHPYDEAV